MSLDSLSGWVYVLAAGDTDRIKIGRTKNEVSDRIAQLQTGNPFVISARDQIATPYASKVESYLHALLATARSESGEWFEVAPAVLDKALAQARDYAEHLERTQHDIDRLAQVEVVDREEPSTASDQELHLELLGLYAEQKRIEVEIEHRETQLKLRIGDAMGLESIATWKAQTGSRLDQSRLRQERPDLYQAFSKSFNSRRFIVSRNRTREN